MDKPTLDAVGRILRDRFADIERKIAAARVTSIERTHDGKTMLVFGDGSTQRIELVAGERGAQGDIGTQGEAGVAGPRGERGPAGDVGERGEPGARGMDGVGIDSVEQDESEPQSFTMRLTNGEAVDVELPVGPQGERGIQGEAGTDRFIAAPRCVIDGERIEKNDLIAWGGGIVQAIRATNRSPGDDPASFVCIVAGVASLAMVENIETRTFDLTARLTNGVEQTVHLRGMPRLLGDGPRPGERIIRGDQFVKGDWLYTATQDGADAANTDAGGWRRQHLRGKRGEDGPRGPQGDAGVGIADVTLDADAGILAVRLTTGEEKYLDVASIIVRAAA